MDSPHTDEPPRFTCISARDIMTLACPPTRWAVPGYVGEGLSILAGRQKLGKTWLALDWAIAVASGGEAMGSVACKQGDVLYIDLENGLTRISARIETLFPDAARRPDLTRLGWTCQAPLLGDGFVEALDEWRVSVKNPRMVVIDVPQHIRLQANAGQRASASDWAALTGLQRWAIQHGVAVVYLYRTRKTGAGEPLETAANSNCVFAYADTTLLLDRDADGVTLHVRGRDVEEKEMALGFAAGRWSLSGDAAERRLSAERAMILEVLEACTVPMGAGDIARLLGTPVANIRMMLFRMAKAGELKKTGRGRYLHPENRHDPENRHGWITDDPQP